MIGVSSQDLSTAVASIYEAAYDQDRWMDAMKSVCDLFDGSRACIVRANGHRRGESAAVGSYEDIAFGTEDWAILGASRLLNGMRSMPVGECYRRADIMDEQAFHREPLWQDYFRPREMDDSLSCNLLRTSESLWAVDVARSKQHGKFDRNDIQLLGRLTPHLLRAGQIGDALQGTSTVSSLYADLPFGMLIVDRQRRLYHLNHAAETMLSSGTMPLLERRGRLVVPSARDAARLEAMIASACGEDSDDMVGTGGTAIFTQKDENAPQRRLLVSVAPLSRTLSYGLPTRRNAAIMIREIGGEKETGLARTLPGLFGLSPAEARIATGLAEGKSLNEIAAENSITVKTARSYLESVFRKTGTHRQNELVSILKTTQPLLA